MADPCARCGQVHTKCAAHKRRPSGSKAPLVPCGGHPMIGKRVCRNHGGKTPGGIASVHFRNGATSKYFKHLPAGMARHFNPDDSKLIELREELALVDAGVIELLARIKVGKGDAPAWAEAEKAFASVRRAAKGAAKGLPAALERLEQLLRRGAAAGTARDQVWDLVDRRARLVLAESRRRKDEHEMVERGQFARFARAVLMSVATNVSDPVARGKIQEDALRILQISQVPLLEHVNTTAEDVPA